MKREDIIAQGYTSEYIDHVAQQIPSLIEESVKRIKYMPFNFDGAFISYKKEGRAASVLKHLCALAGLDLLCVTNFPVHNVNGFKLVTEINGTRRDKDISALINIRGTLQPIANMPLYLEDGAYNRQYVYPIFDWSELQLSVASMLLAEARTKALMTCMAAATSVRLS